MASVSENSCLHKNKMASSVHESIDEAVALYDADRLLDASRALERALASMPLSEAIAATESKPKVAQIRADFAEVQRILTFMNSKEGWIRCYSGANTVVDYRKEPDCVSHTLRAEGTLHAPLKDVAVLLNEPDLFPDIFWFVRGADLCGQKGRFKRAANLTMYAPPPLNNRHVILYGYAIDALDNDNCVMIVTRDRTPADGFHNDIGGSQAMEQSVPPGCVRALLHFAMFELKPVSPGVTKVRLIANSNPKLSFVPMCLINWGSRTIMRFALRVLEARARNVASLPHAHRLSNPVYEWIDSRLVSYWASKGYSEQEYRRGRPLTDDDFDTQSVDFDESPPPLPAESSLIRLLAPLAPDNDTPTSSLRRFFSRKLL